MTEAAILLQILRLPGIGVAGLHKILERLFRLGVPAQRLLELSDVQLLQDLRLDARQVAALRQPSGDPEADLAHCAGLGVKLLLPADPRYPLRALALLGRKAPPLLFTQGNLDLLNFPLLGLSGSRESGEASLAAASEICSAIASQGWVVVSGGAHGADQAAHLAAIRSGPGTIIVLPTGILKPKLDREICRHLAADKTLLLSEFPPEQGWTAGCAMQRNRLLAALSLALVLVEPGVQGGTGGTGRIAEKLGVPLFILQSPAGCGSGAEEFFRHGALPLSAGEFSAPELAALFQRHHQEAEAARGIGQTQSLFAT